MIRYVLKRILLLIPVLLGVIVIVFTINFCTEGSPAFTILGAAATPENVAQVEHEWGLDRPYLVQLGDYIWNIVSKGDLGTSYSYRRPVSEMIAERLPNTVKLGLLSVLFSIVIGIPLGIVAATKQYSALDYSATALASVLAALPSFWLALMLMLTFSVKIRWFPVSGLGTWKHWVLPVMANGIMPVALITRMTRSSMLEVIRQDYIRTARAKGLSERGVIFGHALKNSLIPIITVVGNTAGLAMTGAIIVETVFNIPGLGVMMNLAIGQNDYITTQSGVLVCAIIICLMNLVTDVAYAFVDPRIKAQYVAMNKKHKSKEPAPEAVSVDDRS